MVTLEKTARRADCDEDSPDDASSVPGIDKAKFDEVAKKAKEGCPISRLLKAAEITLDAQLV